MADTLHYFSTDDIAESVAQAMKSVLIDLEEFRITNPGFTKDIVSGTGSISFPKIGVDFRNLAITGNTGSYYPEVLVPEGIVARLVFSTPQPATTITVPDYVSYTTFFVGVLDDLPFDFFTYLGDPLAGSKQVPTIPIGMPVVEDFRVTRFGARGEEATIYGHFCVYGGASRGNKAVVKKETAKLYNALRNNLSAFSAQGITKLLVKPPVYKTYTEDASIHEGAIKFTCVVRLF